MNYKCGLKKRGVASNSIHLNMRGEKNPCHCVFILQQHPYHVVINPLLKSSLGPVREEFHTHTLPHTPQALDMSDL